MRDIAVIVLAFVFVVAVTIPALWPLAVVIGSAGLVWGNPWGGNS